MEVCVEDSFPDPAGFIFVQSAGFGRLASALDIMLKVNYETNVSFR